MKLNEVRTNVESSGGWEEEFFSIKDQGMIFEILRSKMYSNPILAICREISCNARDAHREVGTPETPVHIHLPNNLEPFYKIKDFGPGISPDRMLNIFIKYTASTKRDDNVQTGGFGLGAKTPFAYSDTFSIVTVHQGVRYNYTCIIDASKVGKLMKGSEAPTKEPNGTEIQIPVKPQDFRAFADWTEQATRHWEVKPVIKGNTVTYQSQKKIIEGNGWAITEGDGSWNKAAKMVIDGIEYPLEMDALRKYADAKLIDSTRGNFVMYFGIGELTLSASREQIYLDKQTQDKIRKRMEDIVAEIKKKVTDKIQTFPDLWQANIYYRQDLSKAFHDFRFLGPLKWNNIELNGNYITTGCNTYSFSKGKYSRTHGTDPNKLTRSTGREISFKEYSALFVNDLPLKEPTPRHVKKAFEDDDKLTTVQVICPNDKVSLADLNKSIHLDQMKPRLLSSITKASSRNYTPAASRLLVFKMDAQSSNFRQVSYSSIDEDANSDKVLCLLSKDSYPGARQVVLKNKKLLSRAALKSLATKNTAVSFYGIDSSTPDKRIEEEFEDFRSMDEYLDDEVFSNDTINYVEIKYATQHNYHVDERLLRNLEILEPLIQNKQSPFLKRLDLHKKIKELNTSDLGLLDIYESANGHIDDKKITDWLTKNPELDIEKVNKEFQDKYPLLGAINHYNFNQIAAAVCQYVNLIDKV